MQRPYVTVDSHAGWLLASMSTAGAYLQQSVCLLPARDDVAREVRRLADRVRHQGGSCGCCTWPSPTRRSGRRWSRR